MNGWKNWQTWCVWVHSDGTRQGVLDIKEYIEDRIENESNLLVIEILESFANEVDWPAILENINEG